MNAVKTLAHRAWQTARAGAEFLPPARDAQALQALDDAAPFMRERRVNCVLMLMDQAVAEFVLVEELLASLRESSVVCHVQPLQLPVDDAGMKALRQLYADCGAQGVIALGGGRIIDCAKSLCAALNRAKPVLLAIPTTAGAGSESNALVMEDGNIRKTVQPDGYVLDARLCMPLPVRETAACAMTALTLAVEAAVSRGVSKARRAENEVAVSMIVRRLDDALDDGGDEEARMELMEAAHLAGRSGARGYVACLAAAMREHLPYGECCAALLPLMLELYGERCHHALARLARASGLAAGSMDDNTAAGAFLSWLKDTREHCELPLTLPVDMAAIPQIAQKAADCANPGYAAPVLMDRFAMEQALALLRRWEEPEKDIAAVVEKQKAYFATGATLDYRFRMDALTRLQRAIIERESEIAQALHQDLGKSAAEGYMCEIGMTLAELTHMRRHLKGYMRRHHVLSPLAQFPSDSYTVMTPYGTVLIMSPWNYPLLLTMGPLIGAIAAGNTSVVKPSAYSPATSAVIRDILSDCFPPEYVAVVEGGRAENQALLDQKFDKIFFTGGVSVGREVMRKAAEHLTPVTLELGGKSPAVVDETAQVELAARRIAFGKTLNCGQTCVAPDYVLVHRSVKDDFIRALMHHLDEMVGDGVDNDAYVHMINRKHYDRVCGLIDMKKVVYGGKRDAKKLRIQPTVMDNVTGEDPVMQEEIFGPVLPLITFDSMDEAVAFINARPHPLACYLFSRSKAVQKRFLQAVPFGGGCINDTLIHLATSRMGFGGVGESGMGSYHGRRSFECFSHEKSIVHKANWLDLPIRYAPYTKAKEALVRFFLK